MAKKDEKSEKNIQDAARSMLDAQLGVLRKAAVSQAEVFGSFLSSLQTFTESGAVFKATVQKAGRISIPEAERQALKIKEGDLIQVIVVPIKRS
ncbi:MAG: hypothetical protein HYY68_00165 [Thaumarchaeota archaeon]|nr:hypothetical protein [Nitrososphaerota archaeon]MBI3116659.1 hypothetical protein [Nitrososphaerota archaeon]